MSTDSKRPYLAAVFVLFSAIGIIVYEENRPRTVAVAENLAPSQPPISAPTTMPVKSATSDATTPPDGMSIDDWLQQLESDGPGSDNFKKAQRLRKLVAQTAVSEPVEAPPSDVPQEVSVQTPGEVIAQPESSGSADGLIAKKRAEIAKLQVRLIEKQAKISDLQQQRSGFDGPIQSQSRVCDDASAQADNLPSKSFADHLAYNNAIKSLKSEQRTLANLQRDAGYIDDKIKSAFAEIRSLGRDIAHAQTALDKLAPPTQIELASRQAELKKTELLRVAEDHQAAKSSASRDPGSVLCDIKGQNNKTLDAFTANHWSVNWEFTPHESYTVGIVEDGIVKSRASVTEHNAFSFSIYRQDGSLLTTITAPNGTREFTQSGSFYITVSSDSQWKFKVKRLAEIVK